MTVQELIDELLKAVKERPEIKNWHVYRDYYYKADGLWVDEKNRTIDLVGTPNNESL